MVKNGWSIIDHETLISGISHKWFDEWLNDFFHWADWLNDFYMLIVMEQFLVWRPVYSLVWQPMYLWHLNAGGQLLRIIVFELFEHWTMLILFPFLVLILSIWLTIKPNNFRKLFSWISEKHDQTSLWKGSYKIISVHLSICLCVSLSVIHFYQDLVGGFS